MVSNKIIRTICVFTDNPSLKDTAKIQTISNQLETAGYEIQTKRLASTLANSHQLQVIAATNVDYTSVGAIQYQEATDFLPTFLKTDNLAFNIDLTTTAIEIKHVELLFEIIKSNPAKTFNFAYTFNNVVSSPFFPSARYAQNGFAIGMQPTDLAEDCHMLEDWFSKMQASWQEINGLFASDPEFLGIDSSVAPIGNGNSSFVHFIKRLGYSFDQSATTNVYTTITKFIKEQNPKPIGLCGMMFPCLEDQELAAEYDDGKFSIERNIFLSLHSGLGIDTYPVGIDEKPERIVEILNLIQALSNKYQKPLSARFASDGKAAIGMKTDFKHPYLTDCTVWAL